MLGFFFGFFCSGFFKKPRDMSVQVFFCLFVYLFLSVNDNLSEPIKKKKK